jgi:NodT family efflux transporter outer membrane factor (OMF) lipoprotein
VALKNVGQLDLAYKQAKLGLLPTLGVDAGASRTWPSQNSLNGSLTEQFIGTPYMDDYSASLQFSWEIDIWGKARLQKMAARADYFAQKDNLTALRTRIIAQVAQSYFNLLSLDEQLRIAKLNIALSDSTVRIMELQFKAGQTNSLAVEQVAAQKKTAELLVPLVLQNIALQENALSILCGDFPQGITRTSNTKDLLMENAFQEVPVALLSRRPDVKAAENAVVSANAKTGLAKLAMYPSFSLSPQIGVNAFKINKWFDLPGSITKTVALNLTQSIFQKNALSTAYKSAILEQEKAAIQYKQTLINAVGEVSDAMVRSKGASNRLQLANERGKSLQKATSDAMKLYKSGMATYLEVITAQNNKLQNDLETTTIRLDKLNAITDLYRALGGGIE